ncbi:peptidyl-prolyl cis-trans isomerase C [Rubricella aquisinus]|uniref:Parvulin-like PPIase n=1 Tax=Rubricella aquisinus TaxID=2028108 RepID=A0A840WWD4_9RHOB|nr:peptidylprolyl isomerase [Rubricella aquisinus]MBB5514025.1 peptidyl-prolyl cis-trans isomerase C [Rubricella aquisinus]
MTHLAKAFGAVCLPMLTALPLYAQTTTETPAETPVQAPSLATVLATVNGTDITLGHVVSLRGSLPEQYRQFPAEVLYPGLIDQLIDQTLLANKAEADGLAALPGVTQTLENERRGLLANLGLEALLDAAVTDEALQAAYEEAISGMEQTEEFNASHILVETEEEANALVTRLENGADFAALAREASIGPSGPNGGNLGWFGPGQMVPTFDATVQALTVGEISAPVETQFGWHVVILNDQRLAPLPTLAELSGQLGDQLRQQTVRNEIESLRDAAEITETALDVDPSILLALPLYQE